MKFLKELLISFILFAAFLYFINQKNIEDNLTIIITVVVAVELPITCLFLQYLNNDFGVSFQLDKAQNLIVYKKHSIEKTYAYTDLTGVECLTTATYKKKGDLKIYPQDGYFHYNFHFVNGETITITSLLFRGQLINEANFKSITLIKKTAFFPFI